MSISAEEFRGLVTERMPEAVFQARVLHEAERRGWLWYNQDATQPDSIETAYNLILFYSAAFGVGLRRISLDCWRRLSHASQGSGSATALLSRVQAAQQGTSARDECRRRSQAPRQPASGTLRRPGQAHPGGRAGGFEGSPVLLLRRRGPAVVGDRSRYPAPRRWTEHPREHRGVLSSLQRLKVSVRSPRALESNP